MVKLGHVRIIYIFREKLDVLRGYLPYDDP